MQRHRSSSGSKFAKEYDVKKLVYYEKHKREEDAVEKEKQIKKWKRQWKMRLVDHFNPEWRDLSDDISN
ncbi:MAG: GIY-YIG nuclease family protein [Desulfobacterales bacterium]|nr:GIY-YIG nuclease family protein [Desulfobacterales bacterium]